MNSSIYKTLKTDEELTLSLRKLYEAFGFKKFKVNKFEEYDLYLQNKNFLSCENVITFNDLNGKLLALKPDVTLSIVKSSLADSNDTQKLYYLENVYRTSKRNHEFMEIPQMGLEIIGDVDFYSTLETISLAIHTLENISSDHVLNISHMGIVSDLIDQTNADENTKSILLNCIKQKNKHELQNIGEKSDLNKEAISSLCTLISSYGCFKDVLKSIKPLCKTNESVSSFKELEDLYEGLCFANLESKVSLDFSIVNNLDYYNGVIFQGFIKSLPHIVLSGGRYDNLVKKFGKDSGAIGFALYLGELERFHKSKSSYDFNAIVLYGENSNIKNLMPLINKMIESGVSVRATTKIPSNISYEKLYRFENDKLNEVSSDSSFKNNFSSAANSENNDMLNIALPKGRLGKKVYSLLGSIGFECKELLEGSRKLIFENKEIGVRYFLVKPSDVQVYVEHGAADIGVVGKDILAESQADVYELLDLGFGKCDMCVAAKDDFRDDPDSTLRVATSFENITANYYSSINRNIEIIKLKGSIELAPILKLSDVIVDIVETGTTLKENNLSVSQKIMPISARLIANTSSFQFKKDTIESLTKKCKEALSIND